MLLVIIFIAFIGLGLPDSLSGAGWPVIHAAIGAPLAFAGVLSMTTTAMTIVSSLVSNRITQRFGTGLVAGVSTAMVASGLLLYSLANSVWQMLALCVPIGLGAGAIDAALNHYVAANFSSRNLSHLHCCWGIGAAISPRIMGYFLKNNANWQGGYLTVGAILMGIALLVFLSLRLWKTNAKLPLHAKIKPVKEIIKIKGVKYVMIAFLCYCAIETTAGLWVASYLVGFRGMLPHVAASFASLYFIGITLGRFVSGFFVDRVGDARMIRLGLLVALLGLILLFLPFGETSVAGILILGLGCAPIYPAIIHDTPLCFGAENAAPIIGFEMASAYTGATIIPPLFGLIAQNTTIGIYPFFLLFFLALVFLMTQKMYKTIKENTLHDKRDETQILENGNR
ncbi:MAG: MFS transporter [Christensenellaceae bacterium]|jgi:fucose permease|nr:MFS transporter [Christensenellaceae bacterium]